MNKIIKSTLASLVLLLPSMAIADEITPYVGAGIGSYVIANGGGEDWVFGGYGSIGAEVLPNLALEFRVGSTTNGTNVNSTFGTDWFVSYLAKPQVKLNDMQLNLYGLIGASTIKSFTQAKVGPVVKLSSTTTAFSFGGGLEGYMDKNTTISLEGTILDLRKDRGKTPYKGNFVGSVTGSVRILF